MANSTTRTWVARIARPTGYLCAGAGYLAAMAPIALWSTAVVAWCRARLVLGYWPSYQHPKPSAAGASMAGSVEVLTFSATAVMLAVAFGWMVQRVAKRRAGWVLWMPAVIPAAWCIAYVLLRADPGGILDWWMD